MWISQTYCGFKNDRNAKCYIYFLFEDYKSEQKDFKNIVFQNLEKLGERTWSSSHIFVPTERAEEQIRSELQRELAHVWEQIHTATPGLLFLDYPLQDFDPNQARWAYLGLKSIQKRKDQDGLIIEYFQYMEEFINRSDDVIWEIAHIRSQGIGRRLLDAISIKPSAWGLSFDPEKLSDPFVETGNVFT